MFAIIFLLHDIYHFSNIYHALTIFKHTIKYLIQIFCLNALYNESSTKLGVLKEYCIVFYRYMRLNHKRHLHHNSIG